MADWYSIQIQDAYHQQHLAGIQQAYGRRREFGDYRARRRMGFQDLEETLRFDRKAELAIRRENEKRQELGLEPVRFSEYNRQAYGVQNLNEPGSIQYNNDGSLQYNPGGNNGLGVDPGPASHLMPSQPATPVNLQGAAAPYAPQPMSSYQQRPAEGTLPGGNIPQGEGVADWIAGGIRSIASGIGSFFTGAYNMVFNRPSAPAHSPEAPAPTVIISAPTKPTGDENLGGLSSQQFPGAQRGTQGPAIPG